MQICYHTRKLEKSVESRSAIKKHYGDRAKKLSQRLDDLVAVANLEGMRSISAARCHELTGNRQGELAIDLSPNHRIIFIPDHDPVPRKADGGIDWILITCIVILAIGEDYH
ncbi:MAG: killer suppression protein HigA [Chlorobiaceae bacterium]|nr:killer suppression protein HigA [Chlorobiaceae bacterium]